MTCREVASLPFCYIPLRNCSTITSMTAAVPQWIRIASRRQERLSVPGMRRGAPTSESRRRSFQSCRSHAFPHGFRGPERLHGSDLGLDLSAFVAMLCKRDSRCFCDIARVDSRYACGADRHRVYSVHIQWFIALLLVLTVAAQKTWISKRPAKSITAQVTP